MAKIYTADFETSTEEWVIKDGFARVWAWSICNIENINDIKYGTSIESFFEFCEDKYNNYTFYFHNLKFDGEYILAYLLSNGFENVKSRKDRKDKSFTTIISDTGLFYGIEIFFKVNKSKVNKVTIYDSFKILSFSVDKIAKDFNLPISKLNLDYNRYREIGYTLKDYEIRYIQNDVKIMAMALNIMFKENLNKMTIGSDALKDYKNLNKNFNMYFPLLPYDMDKQIRESYKGGFTYLNPTYKNKITGNGIVFDVNSLYPSVMVNEFLPFGNGLYFDGKYKEDKLYNLYIQTFTCRFDLKENMIPTIQIKNRVDFIPNEYLTTSDGDLVTLTLTNIDLKLFFKHYNVSDVTYHSGWKFKSMKGLFTKYITKWSNIKIESKKQGNGALYKISKLMLNSLYGKFGLSCDVRSKYPYLGDDGIVHYGFYPKETRNGIYIPVASFITSYARYKTITTSQKIKEYSLNKYGVDKYVYSDTDSIHCLFSKEDEKELKQIIDIDDYILGFWKLESEFKKGKFLRQKCYIEEDYSGNINTTIAGLPKNLGKYINFDNFKIGFEIKKEDMLKEHKLTFKHVKGGVILVNTDFSIKEKK